MHVHILILHVYINMLHVYMIISHVHMIKYTCLYVYLVMYTYSDTQITHTDALKCCRWVHSTTAETHAKLRSRLRQSFWWLCVGCVSGGVVLENGSNLYSGQYSKSHNRSVLHNLPFNFPIWNQIEATMCATCVLIIPENSFYFRHLTRVLSNRNRNLSVPGRCSVTHILWQCFFI